MGALPASGWPSVLGEGGPGVPADSGRAFAACLSGAREQRGHVSCSACSWGLLLLLLPLPALGSCPAILSHKWRGPFQGRPGLGVVTRLGCVSVWGAPFEGMEGGAVCGSPRALFFFVVPLISRSCST